MSDKVCGMPGCELRSKPQYFNTALKKMTCGYHRRSTPTEADRNFTSDDLKGTRANPVKPKIETEKDFVSFLNGFDFDGSDNAWSANKNEAFKSLYVQMAVHTGSYFRTQQAASIVNYFAVGPGRLTEEAIIDYTPHEAQPDFLIVEFDTSETGRTDKAAIFDLLEEFLKDGTPVRTTSRRGEYAPNTKAHNGLGENSVIAWRPT